MLELWPGLLEELEDNELCRQAHLISKVGLRRDETDRKPGSLGTWSSS